MWVNVEPTESGMVSVKMNLANAIAVEEYPDRYEINYPGEDGLYRVKKTPEMVEAYNSLVPEKSQPVRPAEPTPEEPFRITGFGLYETRAGEEVRICDRDDQDPDLLWVTKDYRWYSDSGEWCGKKSEYDIVKLIKLDEVQP